MEHKLNGFNDGKSASSGVGGRNPFPTTETEITKDLGDELLWPRFEVILDYPFSDFYLGEIITMAGKSDWYTGKLDWYTKPGGCRRGNKAMRSIEFLSPHPKIFKPLAWWEKIENHYLPKYIKCVEETPEKIHLPGEVYEAVQIPWSNNLLSVKDGKGMIVLSTNCYLPATEKEYYDYNNKTKEEKE